MSSFINLIMQVQSCKRCSSKSATDLAYKQENAVKSVKKPESYMSKKFNSLYNEGHKWNEKKKKMCLDASQQKLNKDLQPCTFKPTINTCQDYFVSNDPFLKREMDWKNAIQIKIGKKREQLLKNEQATLTFQPMISSKPNLTNSVHMKVVDKKITNSTVSSGYSSNNYRASGHQQLKSYNLIHRERKKFKQLTKSTIIQPFKHRQQEAEQLRQHTQSVYPNTMKTVSFHKQKSLRVKLTDRQQKKYVNNPQKYKNNDKQQQQSNHSANDKPYNVPEYMSKSIEIKVVEQQWKVQQGQQVNNVESSVFQQQQRHNKQEQYNNKQGEEKQQWQQPILQQQAVINTQQETKQSDQIANDSIFISHDMI